MDNSARSADSAYYASKQKLVFARTREGSRSKKQVPSYQPSQGDVTASSDKYYATPKPTAEAVVVRSEKTKNAKLEVNENLLRNGLLPKVIQLFAAGNNKVTIVGSQEHIDRAKVGVDMAVGRNVLTRTQADQIVFVEKIVVPVVEQVVVPVVKQQEQIVDLVANALKSMFATDVPVVSEEKPAPKKRGRKSKQEIAAQNATKLNDEDDD
jgi:hypothetical protein